MITTIYDYHNMHRCTTNACVTNFLSRYPNSIERDEATQISDEAFQTCLMTYDPNRGTSISTYYYRTLWNVLLNMIIPKVAESVDDYTNSRAMSYDDRDKVSLDDFPNLSDDACVVMHLALNNDKVTCKNKKHDRGVILRELQKLGWKKRQIYKSFREVKNIVNQFQ